MHSSSGMQRSAAALPQSVAAILTDWRRSVTPLQR
jgi:hypothetical protein